MKVSSSPALLSVKIMKTMMMVLSLFLLLMGRVESQNVTEDGDIPACFFSTEALLNAQLLWVDVKTFKICTNTQIDIGLPSDGTFQDWVGGDFPLTVIHDDITIQCGDDGNVEDNCVLNGGWAQIVTTPNTPFVSDGRTTSTENLIVKGLTFTGSLIGLPGDPQGLDSVSIGLGAPGQNMIIDSCRFTNLEVDTLLYLERDGITTDPSDEMPKDYSDVTIQNSIFGPNLRYRRIGFKAIDQSISIQNGTFNNVIYADCGCDFSTLVGISSGGTTIENSQFIDVEYHTSLVMFQYDYSELNQYPEDLVYIQNNVFENIKIYNESTRTDYCEDGLLLVGQTSIQDGECLSVVYPAPEPTGPPNNNPPSAPSETSDDGPSSSAVCALTGLMMKPSSPSGMTFAFGLISVVAVHLLHSA